MATISGLYPVLSLKHIDNGSSSALVTTEVLYAYANGASSNSASDGYSSTLAMTYSTSVGVDISGNSASVTVTGTPAATGINYIKVNKSVHLSFTLTFDVYAAALSSVVGVQFQLPSVIRPTSNFNVASACNGVAVLQGPGSSNGIYDSDVTGGHVTAVVSSKNISVWLHVATAGTRVVCVTCQYSM